MGGPHEKIRLASVSEMGGPQEEIRLASISDSKIHSLASVFFFSPSTLCWLRLCTVVVPGGPSMVGPCVACRMIATDDLYDNEVVTKLASGHIAGSVVRSVSP